MKLYTLTYSLCVNSRLLIIVGVAPRICLRFMHAHTCACMLAVSRRNVMLTSSCLLFRTVDRARAVSLP